MRKLIPLAMIAALGCGKEEEAKPAPGTSVPSNPEAYELGKKTGERIRYMLENPQDKDKIYEGAITTSSFSLFPVEKGHPMYEGWKDTHMYRFVLDNDPKNRGFVMFDYEDPKLRKELYDLYEDFRPGTKVRVSPKSVSFTLTDRVIKPQELEKVKE